MTDPKAAEMQREKLRASQAQARREVEQEMRVPDEVFDLAERRTAHLRQLATAAC